MIPLYAGIDACYNNTIDKEIDMSYTLAEDGVTVAIKDANTSMIDKLINGVFMPFADSNTLHTSTECAYSSAVYGSVGVVGGGLLTRKRINEEPIMGFLL